MACPQLVKALLAAPPAFALGCAALSQLASGGGVGASLAPLLTGAATPASGDASLAVAAAELMLRALARDAAAAGAGAGAAGSDMPSARALCVALALHSECSPTAAEAVAREAARRGLLAGAEAPPKVAGAAAAAATAAAAASAPELEALSWSLAVATRSTTAAALQQPLVTLDLRLRAPPLPPGTGKAGAEPSVRHERMELTLGQLAVVEASLREALAALDRA